MKSNTHGDEDKKLKDEQSSDGAVLNQVDVDEAMPEEAKEKTAEDYAREYLNDLQRLQADFSNYKKRQQESQKELAGYLIEKLVMEIIPVLDNFRMATEHVPAEAQGTPWVTGIQHIEKQLEKVLADNGMQVVEVKDGDAFDPSIHEAISEAPSTINSQQSAENGDSGESELSKERQSVVKVLQKGYKIGGKVIRPAKVVVG